MSVTLQQENVRMRLLELFVQRHQLMAVKQPQAQYHLQLRNLEDSIRLVLKKAHELGMDGHILLSVPELRKLYGNEPAVA